jgi:hypothetical protein
MSFLIRHGRLLPLLMLFSTVGCATLQDSSYEMTQHLRTEAAFFDHLFTCETEGGWDYSRGWKAGYFDVLTGGDGTPPLIAPHSYWSPWQIIWHCDQKRQKWYMGFQDGAMLASQQPDTHYLKLWSPLMAGTPACLPTACPPVEGPILGIPPEPTPAEPVVPPVPSESPSPPPAVPPPESPPASNPPKSARLLIPPSPQPNSAISPTSYLVPPEPGKF